jgi:xanthine dehydrogenase YagS FAD-binding subunit
MLPAFTYARPRSIEEALELASQPGSRLHAGGTDLLGCLRDGLDEAERLVSLTQIEALRGISPGRDGLRIGAMTTLTEVAASPEIGERYTALSEAARSVASPQLRNQGTLGGNLCQRPRCWYFRGDFDCLRKGGTQCYAEHGQSHNHAIFAGEGCFVVHPSDTAAALVALDARVQIAGPRGERSVPVGQLFVPPERDPERETVLEHGEILVAVLLPAAAEELESSYRKVRGRSAWDFALCGVASAVRLDNDRVVDARVVFSGVAPIPWRSEPVEAALRGKRLDDATLADAAEAAVRGASPLEHSQYKLAMLRGLVLGIGRRP